jgi:dynein heavy chain
MPVLHANLANLPGAATARAGSQQSRDDLIRERYNHYIEAEISTEVIAPIRQHWVTNILSFIPTDMSLLTKERIEQMIDSMLNEINASYYVAGRKSILDYVLKDPEERKRIGIESNPNPPVDYGTQPYLGIEPDEAWQNNVLIARMLISDNLCICSMAILGLKLLWTEYESNLLVDLPRKFEVVSLSEFIERQDIKIAAVKNNLHNEWMSRCVEIIREELETTEMDRN